MPGFNEDWFRGPDAAHIKRNHTYSGEVDIEHFHTEFTAEVTPKLLALYLNNIWRQQNSPRYNLPIYKFFQDKEIEHILEIFTQYYQGYKGSSVEAIIEEESKLTAEEERSYYEELEEEKASRQTSSTPFFHICSKHINKSHSTDNHY